MALDDVLEILNLAFYMDLGSGIVPSLGGGVVNSVKMKVGGIDEKIREGKIRRMSK